MEKIRAEKADIFWNYLATLFNMGFGIISMPILLRYLDSEHLGLWYVMTSFAGIANLFSFGFTPSFSRNINYCWNGASELCAFGKSNNKRLGDINFPLLCDVLISSRLIYLVMACVATIITGFWGIIHIYIISKEIFNLNIVISWFIFLFSIFISLYYGYYSSYLVGIGKVRQNNQIMVFAYIFRLIVMVGMMAGGLGLIGASLAYLIFGAINRFLSKYLFYNANPKLKGYYNEYKKSGFSQDKIKKCLRTIWFNAWRDGIVSIAEYIATQMTTIICSAFFSLSDTAMFSLTSQLVGMIGKVARSIYNAYTPAFQKAYISGDYNTSRETKSMCQTIFVLVYFFGTFVLIFPGVGIIHFFKPDANLNRLFILIYSIYQFTLSRMNCYGYFLSATNRVIYWKSLLITRISVMVTYCIFLYFVLASPWVIVLTATMGELVYNFWKYPKIVKKELNLTEVEIFKIGIKKLYRILGEK